jgi:hypothetical protein
VSDDTPLTAFIDPNYDPLASYEALESWLLLYDTIFVSSPSSFQAARVRQEITTTTFKTLFDAGWLVPVGRPRFFDRKLRTARVKDLARVDAVRSAHFQWQEDFDGAVAEKAVPLPDEDLDNAINTALALEHRQPRVFASLQERVSLLRSEQKLPAKFYTPSEVRKSLKHITRGVIYEVAGDLWARQYLGTSGLIVPAEQEGIYGLLDDASTGPWSPLRARVGAAKRSAADGLTEQDLRLARELGERIARHYSISNLLADYRASALQQEFRAFVLGALEDVRRRADGAADSDLLWQRFQEQIKRLDTMSTVGQAIGTMLGAGGTAVVSSKMNLDNSMTRRFFMIALLSGATFGGAKLFSAGLPRVTSEVFNTPDRWITFIHKRATPR